MEHEVSDRNEWFKDVKRLIRGLEVETVEDPFACPTVKSVTDGEDVLHALGLHPSRDDGYRYIVNMDKISFVNVAGRKVWAGEVATLAICDESMERLLSRLRGEGDAD